MDSPDPLRGKTPPWWDCKLPQVTEPGQLLCALEASRKAPAGQHLCWGVCQKSTLERVQSTTQNQAAWFQSSVPCLWLWGLTWVPRWVPVTPSALVFSSATKGPQ